MKTMRTLFLSVLILFSSASNAQSKKKIRIYGHITYASVYKGGAKPTEEILKKCCQPEPYAGKKLYLKENYYSKPIAVLETDAEGNFKKCLREGSYNIYLENEIKPDIREEDETAKAPYGVLELKRDGKKEFYFDFKERRNSGLPKP